MKKLFPVLALLFVTSAFAGTAVKVATLNCFLFFSPLIDHPGKVDNENRLSAADYATKVEHLASLTAGIEFVGLEETGGAARR